MKISCYFWIAAVLVPALPPLLSGTGCSPETGNLSVAVIKGGLKAGCNGCEVRRIPEEGEAEGEPAEGETGEGEAIEGESGEGEGENEGETEGEGEGEDIPVEMFPISSGTFKMGRPYEDVGDRDELPVHSVSLDGYWIAKYEVTNSDYAEALNWALGKRLLKNGEGTSYNGGIVYAYGRPLVDVEGTNANAQIVYNGQTFSARTRIGYEGTVFSMEEHPVVMVSWYGAAAYCNWLSTMHGLQPSYSTSNWTLLKPARNGYRLPSEAEWERAAAWEDTKHWRYGTTNDTMDFTWSNQIEINPLWLTVYPYTSPVGWYDEVNPAQLRVPDVSTNDGVSPAGAFDMYGNVLVWW